MFKEYQFQDLEYGNLFYFAADVDRRLYYKLSSKMDYCRFADVRLLLGGMMHEHWYKYFVLNLKDIPVIELTTKVRIVSYGQFLD